MGPEGIMCSGSGLTVADERVERVTSMAAGLVSSLMG